MSKRCTACNRLFPNDAAFCAICGKSLSVDHGATHASAGARGLAVLLAAAVTAVTAFTIYHFSSSNPPSSDLDPSVPMVWRELELPQDKADMLFQLLRPNDIKILVDRDDCRLKVNGSPGEVATIIGLGELITRFQGVPIRHIKAHLSKIRLSKKDYKLSRSSACRLFDLLAFDDVPVWVVREGRSLQIIADPSDQQMLANLASILRGKRFR